MELMRLSALNGWFPIWVNIDPFLGHEDMECIYNVRKVCLHCKNS